MLLVFVPQKTTWTHFISIISQRTTSRHSRSRNRRDVHGLYYGESTGPVGTVLATATAGWVSTGIYSSPLPLTRLLLICMMWHDGAGTEYAQEAKFGAQHSNTAQRYRWICFQHNKHERQIHHEREASHAYVYQGQGLESKFTQSRQRTLKQKWSKMPIKVFRVADDFEVIPYGPVWITPECLTTRTETILTSTCLSKRDILRHQGCIQKQRYLQRATRTV